MTTDQYAARLINHIAAKNMNAVEAMAYVEGAIGRHIARIDRTTDENVAEASRKLMQPWLMVLADLQK